MNVAVHAARVLEAVCVKLISFSLSDPWAAQSSLYMGCFWWHHDLLVHTVAPWIECFLSVRGGITSYKSMYRKHPWAVFSKLARSLSLREWLSVPLPLYYLTYTAPWELHGWARMLCCSNKAWHCPRGRHTNLHLAPGREQSDPEPELPPQQFAATASLTWGLLNSTFWKMLTSSHH